MQGSILCWEVGCLILRESLGMGVWALLELLLFSGLLMDWTLLMRSSTHATELRGHLSFVSGREDKACTLRSWQNYLEKLPGLGIPGGGISGHCTIIRIQAGG